MANQSRNKLFRVVNGRSYEVANTVDEGTLLSDPFVQQLAYQVAACIEGRSDPVGDMALFQQEVFAQMKEIQEEQPRPYITSTERMAREEGHEEGYQEGFAEVWPIIVEVLNLGDEGLAFVKELQQVKDSAKLRAVKDALQTTNDVDELRKLLL